MHRKAPHVQPTMIGVRSQRETVDHPLGNGLKALSLPSLPHSMHALSGAQGFAAGGPPPERLTDSLHGFIVTCYDKYNAKREGYLVPPLTIGPGPVAACQYSQDPTVKLQEADIRRTTKSGRLAVGTRSGSSAIDRLARSARALASFASYANPLLSHTEIVSSGPERRSDLGKAETS
jgi:hypothetical protein